MAFKGKFNVASFIILLVFVSSCKKTPSESKPPGGNGFPDNLGIVAPSTSETYWTDRSVPCAHNEPDYADKTEWLVGEGEDAEAVSCTDGKLDTELPEGEHTVTAKIAEGDESVEASVTITVKEGFSVTLDRPKSGTEYFVGDEVACEATVEPEMYEEYLTITAGGSDCTSGEVELTQAGETTIRAVVDAYGRTEADEAAVTVKQAVAGRVYPLTDQGVTGGAGFTVTLTAGGDVLDTQTDADGNFAIKSEAISVLGDEEVTLSVAETGNFYGSKAVLPASELLALVEADRLGFILAPRSWTIRDGKLAGQSTNLKLRAAFTRVIADDPGTSFYKLWKVFGEHKYISTHPEHRPFHTAFNRAESSTDITASDSTSFWEETDDELEPNVGRGDLFTAATLAEVPSKSDGIHVHSEVAGERSSAGFTTEEGAYIVGGRINLAIDKFGKSSTATQQHEQVHNLGFGHASQWDGIMTYEIFDPLGERIRVPGKNTDMLTVIDVAHIQVYMDAFDLQFSQDISFGVLEWKQAMDIPGLPETTSSQAKMAGKRFASYTYEAVECRIH